MKYKQLAKIVMFLVALAILINNVSAIGISPAKRYIDYQPGKIVENKIRVFNDNENGISIIVHVQGDIAEYIELEKSEIDMNAGQDMVEIKYTVNMPNKIEKPGIHEGYIIVFEVPEGKNINDVGVGAVLAVSSAVKLRVPYPKQYAEASLYVEDSEVGEDVSFLIPVFNYGVEELNDVYAKIEIYGATYEKIGEVITNSVSITPGNQKELGVGWGTDENQGVYKAVATVYYGTKSIRLEKTFDIGSVHIKINGISVDSFVLGSVAKFDILIENIWNNKLEDVYADIIFKDEAGNEQTRFKTANVEINSYETGVLNAYWDTKGLSVGKYYLDVTLNYAGKTSNSLIETFVNLNSITTNKLVGRVIKGEGSAKEINILILGLIVLVIINVGWFIYFKKFKKK